MIALITIMARVLSKYSRLFKLNDINMAIPFGAVITHWQRPPEIDFRLE
ncbi:hypothetical protein [Lacticaseibacillus sp. N501-2]